MPNAAAAAQAGLLLLQDYRQNRNNSAICLYLELERDAPLGSNPFLAGQYERLCEPFDENPPTPPSQDFFNAGGVPCRLYRVTYQTGTVGQAGSVSQQDLRGPIRLNRSTFTDQGAPGVLYTLYGGDGINCPIQSFQIAGSNNTNIVPIFCNLLSVVPLEGDPETEVPIPIPPEDPDPTPLPPFGFNVNVDIAGFEVNVPVNFEPVINNNFGPFIPFTFAPTANFNLQFDPTISNSPRFGIDLDLEVVIPLGNGNGNGEPLPNAEPVPIPGNDPELTCEPTVVDYERIERAIEEAKCCRPITLETNVGTFNFESPNDVFTVSLPNDTVCVFLDVIAGENTRVFKLAGDDAEYGFGNASVMVNGYAIEFVRIFVGKHVIFFPEETSQKSVRLSLGEGCQCSVKAGRYIPVEAP